MSAAETHGLWLRLKAEGLVAGDMPPEGTAPAPWFVRVMMGVAGWIGAAFLLAFVGAVLRFVLESAPGALFAGCLTCAVAGALFRARPENDFLTQFGLAVSLAGQGLVLIGLIRVLDPHTGAIALGMVLFESVLFVAIPDFTHRVWAAGTAGFAAYVLLQDFDLQAYAPALLAWACGWVWLNEFRHAHNATLLRAGGYGLVLALLGSAGVAAWTGDAVSWRPAGLGGAVLVWAVWCLLVREAVDPDSRAGVLVLAAAGLLAAATVKAPGLAPSALILLLGYANGNRVLAGIGIGALLGYLSFYYYALDMTLLRKAALLAATGIALLAARFALHRLWPAPQRAYPRA